ncbi:hypothetical protein EJD97_005138 [Solanum chilense]|uniref:HMA domain-containing protein n=1 Tax=Solanum chilense TaxID=4083 RepID=A0A6N2AMI0_SOLCI|nr:hypothetical protein EJD97_005138 [Solanum chilense]
MKDMFCASQAATEICLSMEELGSSSSSSSVIQLGGGSISGSRTIDRYNPIIRDSRRTGPKSISAPCSARSPIPPKPHSKSRKSTSKESKRSKKLLIEKDDEKRKSSVSEGNENIFKTSSWSCKKPGEFITPPGSSRYLLSEKNILDALSDFEPVLKLVDSSSSSSVAEDVKTETDQSCPPPSASANQVVVLRVSLHCRGCEKKMRKHISRMQGVKSFNIDFAAKKVTVTGDVTPLGVLASISKVKNAQLWTPTLASAVPTAKVNLSNSELKNNDKQMVLSHEKIENVTPTTTTIQLM